MKNTMVEMVRFSMAVRTVLRGYQNAYAVAPLFPTATYPKPLLTRAFVDIPVLFPGDQSMPFWLV